MSDLNEWKGKIPRGRKGPNFLDAGMWVDDVYFPPKPPPSAIDLLGDLAVSDEERELRVERRQSVGVELHVVHIIVPVPDPDVSAHSDAP